VGSKERRYKDAKSAREPGGFIALPYVVIRSAEWAALSPRATKLVNDFMAQLNGKNNGDLCAAMKVMRPRGWRSKALLARAVAELEERNFIVRTRLGGKNRATLYGVTFFRIEWCEGKLDIDAPTRAFMGSWRTLAPPRVGQRIPDYPAHGAITMECEADCPTGRPSQAGNGELVTPQVGPSIEVPLSPGSSL
jgi:hypothetical protein